MENTFIINKNDKNIAYIYSKQNNIYVEFYKHPKFIDVIKKFAYTWNGSIWTKSKDKFSPSLDDMMAEIGTNLIYKQINIKVQNEKIYKMIEEKNFEPECFRWIVTTKADPELIFYIRNTDKTIIKPIKKITGIRYVKGFFRTKINNYEEVFKFADTYNFKISKETMNKIISFEKEFIQEYNNKILKGV